jgi:hypothetical protein
MDEARPEVEVKILTTDERYNECVQQTKEYENLAN